MKDLKIGVVGGGVVGRATARTYLEHVSEVRVYDLVKERSTHNLPDVLACDLVFVCLPTPQKVNSLECDLSAVEGFFTLHQIGSRKMADVNLVLRSTVPIGTTWRLAREYSLPNLVHSPEFLTARCAQVDAQVPSRNIIGLPGKPQNFQNQTTGEEKRFYPGNPCGELLGKLYAARFPGVGSHWLSSEESEAVKLIQNSFFAVKVAFWNEMRTLADHHGMDWPAVLRAVLADGRIHPSHTQVPGPDGQYGFGGTCLPKDLANLINTSDGMLWGDGDTGVAVCHAAYRRNQLDRKRRR